MRSLPLPLVHILSAVLLLVGLAAPSDAQVLLTQAKLNAGLGGCDAPGYPLTICKPGSYRLTGNLGFVVGRNPNVDIVHITSNGVTLDLNGFLIGGVCATGAGVGIRANPDTVLVTIMNGSVTCMGSWGVLLEGGQNRIERMAATMNGSGMNAGDDSIVRDSSVIRNGNTGLSCGETCVVSGNTSRGNYVGIIAFDGSTIIGNSVRENQVGILAYGAGYSQNVMSGNSSNVQSGTSMAHNLCSGVPC